MKKTVLFLIYSLVPFYMAAIQWKPRTTDWSANPNPVIGDWGFNRPNYPPGLYIHGITVKTGEKVTNPVIYDNDAYDDVFDDEWAYAMASLGEMNLIALISTPVLTDGWTFYHPEWKKEATDSRARAINSGMCANRIPAITIGTEANSETEGVNKNSAGAQLYVKLINDQYAKDPSKPLIINMGGQSATLASAYNLDQTIANKCIVYYTDIKVYNGHYKWASELIAKNFRVVSWGSDNWWISKSCQNQWNVLPRPANCTGNDKNSGEWAQLTSMKKPILDYVVERFQNRNEYCCGQTKGDAYGDGSFIHAWAPGMFADAALQIVRGGEVLHITKFTATGEAIAKAATFPFLKNPNAYDGICQPTSVEDRGLLQELTIYPNPANNKTRISFIADKTQAVSLKVYDLQGREISAIMDEKNLPVGNHEYEYSLNTTGIYFIKLIEGEKQSIRKVVFTNEK